MIRHQVRSFVLRSWRVALAVFLVVSIASVTLATELVHFDLGQPGAASLIIQDAPTGRYCILVDAGNVSRSLRGGAKIRAYLHAHKITKLDLVILTHVDKDHVGGIENLLAPETPVPPNSPNKQPVARGPPITIETVLEPGPLAPDKPVYARLRKMLDAYGIRRITPADQAIVAKLSRRYGIDILAPSFAGMSYNDTSLGVLVHDTSGATDFITGDMTARAWEQVKPELRQRGLTRVRVLNAPHHGGEPALLNMVQILSPEFIVIQSNAGNQYGHPRIEILQKLAQFGKIDTRALTTVERNHALQHDLLEQYESHRGNNAFEQMVADTALAQDTRATAAYMHAQRAAAREPHGYDTRHVLITSREGNIHVHPNGDVTTQRLRDPVDRFRDEVRWNESQYLAPEERASLKNAEQAEVYLWAKATEQLRELRTLLAANAYRLAPPADAPSPDASDLLGPDAVKSAMQFPLWFADYERIMTIVAGGRRPIAAGIQIDGRRLDALARAALQRRDPLVDHHIETVLGERARAAVAAARATEAEAARALRARYDAAVRATLAHPNHPAPLDFSDTEASRKLDAATHEIVVSTRALDRTDRSILERGFPRQSRTDPLGELLDERIKEKADRDRLADHPP